MKIAGTLALAGIALLLVMGLWPRDYVACPDWDIYVVDQDHKPMPGVPMHVSATDPKVEDRFPSLDFTTDEQGHVFVARRVVRSSRLRSMWGALKQFPALAHAETKSNGYAHVPPPTGYGYANPGEPGESGAYWYNETGHVRSTVILYRCAAGVRRYGCEAK